MNVNEVLSRFQNCQRNGNGFKARCPLHEDKKNSLSIGEGDGGKILSRYSTKQIVHLQNIDERAAALEHDISVIAQIVVGVR